MTMRAPQRLILSIAAAAAATFPAGPSDAQASFDWASVGNAGNAADTNGRGSVGYQYHVASTEVTNAQYITFLNSVAATDTFDLYDTNMAGDFGGITRDGSAGSYTYGTKAGRTNNPVNFVTWYDAARFVNWMHNGQGGADTETGAYTLLGGTPTPSNKTTLARNAGANYFLPSQDEWYKAAYHDASAGTEGVYFDFATGTDDTPFSDDPNNLDTPDNTNVANFFRDDEDIDPPHTDPTPGYNNGHAVWNQDNGFSKTAPQSSDHPFTDVGAFVDALSPYGTFDQNGSVWEWNENITTITVDQKVLRNIAGGAWDSGALSLSTANTWNSDTTTADANLGFRIATLVPEPSSLAVLGLGGLLLARRRAQRL